MTDAREIIAECIKHGRPFRHYETASEIITALHASGFRILGPDEVDPVTVEKCAEVADQHTLAVCTTPDGSQTSAMRLGASSIAAAIRAIGRKA